MARIVQETYFELADRELLALERVEGHVLACLSGELWITLDGRQEDIILGAGQNWKVPSNAPLVVSALKPSVLATTHSRAHVPCIVPRNRAGWLKTALLRWKHQQPFAGLPATLLR